MEKYCRWSGKNLEVSLEVSLGKPGLAQPSLTTNVNRQDHLNSVVMQSHIYVRVRLQSDGDEVLVLIGGWVGEWLANVTIGKYLRCQKILIK